MWESNWRNGDRQEALSYVAMIDRLAARRNYSPMSNIIFPRSARETMAGWIHLPRFVDKIRLHLAGKLHADYQDNFTKGFDGVWLKAAGIEAGAFIEVWKYSIPDC